MHPAAQLVTGLSIVATLALVFVIHQLKVIMATQTEHAQALRDLKAQNDKAAAEQAAALKKLQDALDAAGGTTAEVDAAMAELKASIQTEDDLNPDTPADPQA